jgi:hypothetical protein
VNFFYKKDFGNTPNPDNDQTPLTSNTSSTLSGYDPTRKTFYSHRGSIAAFCLFAGKFDASALSKQYLSKYDILFSFQFLLVTSCFSVLTANSLFSILTVNSFFSILSINCVWSLLSLNSAFSIGCVNSAFCIFGTVLISQPMEE